MKKYFCTIRNTNTFTFGVEVEDMLNKGWSLVSTHYQYVSEYKEVYIANMVRDGK